MQCNDGIFAFLSSMQCSVTVWFVNQNFSFFLFLGTLASFFINFLAGTLTTENPCLPVRNLCSERIHLGRWTLNTRLTAMMMMRLPLPIEHLHGVQEAATLLTAAHHHQPAPVHHHDVAPPPLHQSQLSTGSRDTCQPITAQHRVTWHVSANHSSA